MAVTFDDIVSRVKQQLLGYTRDQAPITYLTQPMTDTDSTLTVDVETVKSVSRGLIEVDDELMLVKKFDQGSGVVTLFPGRGVDGTTPASHSVNTLVTADPRYPRSRIKEAINDAINGVYPDLWVFGTYEFPWLSARYEYPIPAEVEQVYKVTSNTIGPSGVWFPNSSWRFNPQASTTPGQVLPTPAPTGKTIQVMRDFIVPGRNVRVIYTKKPNTLTNNDDDFTLTTGLEERVLDLIVYGACWRLLPATESARLQQSAVEATERAPLVPTGASTKASQYYMNLYQIRLAEERDRLLDLYPMYQHWNG